MRPNFYTNIAKEVITRIMDSNSKTEGMENFNMDSNEAMSNEAPKCECGQSASIVAAFRTAPRVLCAACYSSKSIKFLVDEAFLLDALEVIEREQSLKHSTLARLRGLIETITARDGSTR